MRKPILVAIAFALALIAAPCFGWGRDGHRIAGAIAWQYLTDKAKAAIQDLLGEQTLATAGNWADEIRSDSNYKWAKPLHYAICLRIAFSRGRFWIAILAWWKTGWLPPACAWQFCSTASSIRPEAHRQIHRVQHLPPTAPLASFKSWLVTCLLHERRLFDSFCLAR